MQISTPHITGFGADDYGWDIDSTGLPGIGLVGNAIQVWAVCQNGPQTIGAAAQAFNLPLAMIAQAVDEHLWMGLAGPAHDPNTIIEHDGE